MKGKLRLAAVDYEGLGNYNSAIESLVKLYSEKYNLPSAHFWPLPGLFFRIF